MKKALKKTSAMLCAITVAASSVSLSGFVASAGEPAPTSDYTITIPATLTVANSGWNATDGISATGTLAQGKKLVVTASSDDEFALVSGENKIGYKLATASTDTEATTSWEFTELSSTAATKPMGIIVDDYSGKPAGTYQDFVTFTATVENAVTIIDSNTTALTTGKYIVPETSFAEIPNLVTVSGDVELEIESSGILYLGKGLSIDEGSTITVTGKGSIYVNGTSSSTDSTVAGEHGTLVLTSGDLSLTGGSGQGIFSGNTKTGADGGIALNGSVLIEGGTVYAYGGYGGRGGGTNSTDDIGGNGAAAVSGDMTVNGGQVVINGGYGGNTGADGERNKGGNGAAAVNGDLFVYGGEMHIYRGTDGRNGEDATSSIPGTGGDGYNGTLTLGEGIVLYDVDYNYLDDAYSSSRVYQGEKKPTMLATELLT